MALRIPLLAEQLEVDKRSIESARVRIRKSVAEQHETVLPPPLERHDVEIERVAVDRVVERVEPPRTDGELTIVPIYEEVAVVTTQLVLKEELHIRRRSVVEPQAAQRVTLRRERVEIERRPAGDAAPAGGDAAAAPQTPAAAASDDGGAAIPPANRRKQGPP